MIVSIISTVVEHQLVSQLIVITGLVQSVLNGFTE